ncbi:hypothetical protein PanWU01x14_316220 [Parasponia andersonii]|uniref:Uncharacterized protein n=1 Tax=Parasponia andersonii TaxID=3476 RepID=A0A2P5AN70_PARAD|nr:hypothetical protein PanWU01x14_316220 [Parasponia andersonii]
MNKRGQSLGETYSELFKLFIFFRYTGNDSATSCLARVTSLTNRWWTKRRMVGPTIRGVQWLRIRLPVTKGTPWRLGAPAGRGQTKGQAQPIVLKRFGYMESTAEILRFRVLVNPGTLDHEGETKG